MATPSKAPVLVLSLIFTMLVLSVGSIALIVLFNANRPDSAAIAAACKSEVGVAIKTESDKVAKACEETKNSSVKSVPAVGGYPGFNYPATWAAAIVKNGSNADNASLLAVHVTDSYFDPSIAVTNPIVIRIYKKTEEITTAGSFIEWVKKQGELTLSTPAPTLTEKTVNGRKALINAYTIDGPGAGAYQDYYFEGTTTFAVVQTYWGVMTGGDFELIDEYKKNMNTVLSSLDFSVALD